MKLFFYIILIFPLLVSCSSNGHKILGSSFVFDHETNVLADVRLNDLHLRHVRAMDAAKMQCMDGNIEFLEINGKVGEDSTYLVKKFLEEMNGCRKHRNSKEYFKLVILNSQGGSFINGIRMGELFRRNNVLTVLVPGQSCSSACAIAFLGGAGRVMSNQSKLTFHAPYVKKQLSG